MDLFTELGNKQMTKFNLIKPNWTKRKKFIATLLIELAIATGAGAIDPFLGFTTDAGMVVLHVLFDKHENDRKASKK